jgi:hypothetical protein
MEPSTSRFTSFADACANRQEPSTDRRTTAASSFKASVLITYPSRHHSHTVMKSSFLVRFVAVRLSRA